MLAMQYRLPIPSRLGPADIEARVADRGPHFDGWPGLAAKAFLLGRMRPGTGPEDTYAAFYAWRDDGAARRFLASSAFAAVAATFGRPAVQLWPIVELALPDATPALARLESLIVGGAETADGRLRRDRDQWGAEGGVGRIVALDADRWTIRRLRFFAAPPADATGLWRVLYLARENAVTPSYERAAS